MIKELGLRCDWVGDYFSLLEINWKSVQHDVTKHEAMMYSFIILGVGIYIVW